jgi:type I restriction enzyme, R subunit
MLSPQLNIHADQRFVQAFHERMDQDEEIFVRFMNDAPLLKVVTTWMAEEAYRRLARFERQPVPNADSLRHLVQGG